VSARSHATLISTLAVSLAALSAPALAGTAPVTANDGALRVVVSDVRSSSGQVRVDVCPQSDFLKDCRFGAEAPARQGETVVVVPGLPPGEYAVQAYHDGNQNHQVDRNIIGLPTEEVGFSKDPPLRLHAPTFKSTAFNYSGGEQTISLRLRHFTP
jgi:uncharacterized protein (DUF2141 family)